MSRRNWELPEAERLARDERKRQLVAAMKKWGAEEFCSRQSDIAAVRRGEMTLQEAQKRARSRRRKANMTSREALAHIRPSTEDQEATQ